MIFGLCIFASQRCRSRHVPGQAPSRALRSTGSSLAGPSSPSPTTLGVFPNGSTPDPGVGALPDADGRRWMWVCVWWMQLAGGGGACACCVVLSSLGWESSSRARGSRPLGNWSPPLLSPLYISQTWKLKKVKFMRKMEFPIPVEWI